ncbi:hypothetical protein [Streptomyces sp. 7N604]|uniref:hypothetical protein n=1 Tax=Streptomyces sp. 7N604 TaxID=3457415 RepID=UPI003FD6B09F
MNESMPGAEQDREPERVAGAWHEGGPGADVEQEASVDAAVDVAGDAAQETVHESDAGPAPLGIPRTPTGNAEVDAQLDRLADADHLPPDGHIEVYEDVHRGLRDALTALDARPGPPPPAPSGPAPGPYDNRS